MRILIAPDKFKGSLSAREVAESIAAGLHDVPKVDLELVPVGDGGEGTAEVICSACQGEWVMCDAHDALGRPIRARYAWLQESETAVMDMSETAGMWRVAPAERDPFCSNTCGVGEMLLDAARRQANEVIVGLGGSATNDGGFGMARALGFRFLNGSSAELSGPVSDLLHLEHISSPPLLFLPRVKAAVDVRNPLLGTRGATRIFGPQKGVASDQLEVFEEALARLADVVARDLGCDFRDSPGAGAAGGLGFGLMSFCGATISPGFELVAEMLHLDAIMRRADIVVTGEGHLDDQTLEGKAPAGVARLARRLGKRVFAIVGSATEETITRDIFDGVLVLEQPPVAREESMTRASALLQERARELGGLLSLSCS